MTPHYSVMQSSCLSVIVFYHFTMVYVPLRKALFTLLVFLQLLSLSGGKVQQVSIF